MVKTETATSQPAASEQPLNIGIPVYGEIGPLDRARLRVECLKCALELRAASKPICTVIAEAREFETYVTGAAPAEERKD